MKLRAIVACITSASAWWDEGHMLIAAVGQQWLLNPDASLPWTSQEGKEAYQRITKALQSWANDYPKFVDIISSATWADFIKCQNSNDSCSLRLGSFEAMKIFNNLHFVDVLYNLNKTESEQTAELNKAFKWDGTAYELLRQVDKSLSISNIGTTFSFNLQFRLFLHVFTDIHQPLHSMAYKDSKCFKNGDAGGNLIKLHVPADLPGGPANVTLHSFWDNAAFELTTPYQNTTIQTVERNAQAYYTLGKNMIPRDIKNTIRDTYRLAREVYAPIFKYSMTECPTRPVVIDEEYVRTTRRICRDRIAQGGKSIALLMKKYSDNLKRNEEEEEEAWVVKTNFQDQERDEEAYEREISYESYIHSERPLLREETGDGTEVTELESGCFTMMSGTWLWQIYSIVTTLIILGVILNRCKEERK